MRFGPILNDHEIIYPMFVALAPSLGTEGQLALAIIKV